MYAGLVNDEQPDEKNFLAFMRNRSMYPLFDPNARGGLGNSKAWEEVLQKQDKAKGKKRLVKKHAGSSIVCYRVSLFGA